MRVLIASLQLYTKASGYAIRSSTYASISFAMSILSGFTMYNALVEPCPKVPLYRNYKSGERRGAGTDKCALRDRMSKRANVRVYGDESQTCAQLVVGALSLSLE